MGLSFKPTPNGNLAFGVRALRATLCKLAYAWMAEFIEATEFANRRFVRPPVARLIADVGYAGVTIEAISHTNGSIWRKQTGWADYSRELIDEGLGSRLITSS